MTAAVLEFHYDIVCPYAYLASTQIEALAERTGARLVWSPFLLGGVFRALGTGDDPNQGMPPAKASHNRRDMDRWATHFEVPLVMPEAHPRRTVLALRAILASSEVPRASRALFDAYWARGEDVADEAVVARALDDAGLDGDACVRGAADDAVKRELRERTDAAVAAGVFGAPTFVVGEELFWGQDRLHFVEAALRGIPLREAARVITL